MEATSKSVKVPKERECIACSYLLHVFFLLVVVVYCAFSSAELRFLSSSNIRHTATRKKGEREMGVGQY